MRRFLLTTILTVALTATGIRAYAQAGGSIGSTTPWPLHHIDRALWNHNSLSPGDVDQDGYVDYAVLHEGRDVYSIVFHPGDEGDVHGEWRKVIIGETGNAEYSYLGDFDGDGNLDLVTVGGFERDRPTGVSIFWGPEPDDVYDPEAWVESEFLPGTAGRGHYLFVESHDVNGDGALDIVTGARVHRQTGKTGMTWLEAPSNPDHRRDVSRWQVHDIDPGLLSGHGFEFTDIDEDGDADIVLVNADWDTPDTKERLLWYENPNDPEAQRGPWSRHVIYDGHPQFFAKAQVAVGDLDADGRTDLAVQTDNNVIYLKKTAVDPVSWEAVVIPKPDLTRWVNRPIAMADLDGDGKLDLVGALIHNYGYTPRDKASVYWMEYEGDEPSSDNWTTHVIKWADGTAFTGSYQGEKWDHLRFEDVDRDGDVDIVANAEEHYEFIDGERRTRVGVAWFENRLNEGSARD